MSRLETVDFTEHAPWLRSSRLRYGLTALALIVLLVFIWQSVSLVSKYRQTLQVAQQWSRDKTETMAESLSVDLARLTFAAHDLANVLDKRSLSEAGVESALRTAALNHDGFYALGAAFDLYRIRPDLRLYAPFIRDGGRASGLDKVDQYYDYRSGERTSLGESWFQRALQGDSRWLAPFHDPVHEQSILKYVVPLDGTDTSTENAAADGVVFVDVGLDWLGRQVEAHDVGANGYSVVVNHRGQVLHHGLNGYRETIESLDRPLARDDLDRFRQGRLIDNPLTGRVAWKHGSPIGNTGWYLLTVMDVQRIEHSLEEAGASRLIHKTDWIAWIVSAVALLLIAYLWWIVIRRKLTLSYVWRHSAFVSLLFLSGIVGIWFCEHYAPTPAMPDARVLSNGAGVRQFQEDYAIESLKQHRSPPVYIPTGVFIQSLEFVSASNVTLTGYIWQRYPESELATMGDGVIFPEAVSTTFKKSYQREQGDEVVKGWYFETTLRELFDYSTFPFDRQSVWLRLWHDNFSDNVVLVPDFASYDSLNPSALPGLEREFVLSGWDLSRSFYDIRMNAYNSRFGRADFDSHDQKPELYFNIELDRNFLNPFIAHLFPLAVVLLMLYAIMVTTSRQEQKKELFGFDVSTVVASCSALFFVILIAHVQLRDELSADSIIYLEYFYLISYVVLLMITVNAILFTWDLPIRFVKFHDNLIPKLIYWPVLLGGFFICTAVLFW